MAKRPKTIIHVNQHVIRANRKNKTQDPVLTIKQRNSNRYGMQALLKNKEGEVLGKFVYSPGKPLSCGAEVWFETDQLIIETN